MPLSPDPLRIYLAYDEQNIPDWKAATMAIRCAPGCVAVERLQAPERQGALYIPSRAQHTYYEDDDPVAGFEPSVGIVLSAGVGVCLSPGQIVIMHDGDGVEFEDFQAGAYKSTNPVMVFGVIVPDDVNGRTPPPGYVEELPWEESILGVVEGMDIKGMTGKNVLLERDHDDSERKTEGGVILPDVVAENAASEATVLKVGPDVRQCKPGDRVFYHPLGCNEFYDPQNRRLRVVRELAILMVTKQRELATV